MKPVILLALAILCSLFEGAAQRINPSHLKSTVFEFGFGYQYLSPPGNAGRSVNPNGMQIQANTRLLKQRLAVGIEAGFGMYDTHSENLTWTMNGREVTSKLDYDNSLSNLGLMSRYYFRGHKPLQYFLMGGVGNMYHKGEVVVYDPEDDDDCIALERNRYNRSRATYGSIGAGVALATGFFKANDENEILNMQIDFSIRYIASAPLRMVDIHNLHNGGPESLRGTPIDMPFVSITTQTQHTHRVGYLQESPLRGLMIQVSLIMGGTTSKQPKMVKPID